MEYPEWIYKEREHYFDGHFYRGISESRIEDRKYIYEILGISNIEEIDEIVSHFREKYAVSTWHGLSKAQRRQIYIDNAAKCYHCGKVLTRKEFTIEHLLPITLGGANDEENLAIACGTCNQEYSKAIDQLISRLENEQRKLQKEVQTDSQKIITYWESLREERRKERDRLEIPGANATLLKD